MDVRSILSHELVVGDYLGVLSSMHHPEPFGRVEKLEYIDADLGQALASRSWPAETDAATWVGGARPAQRAGVVDQHQPGSVRSNRALAESTPASVIGSLAAGAAGSTQDQQPHAPPGSV
jgi:hypothetical protein